MNTKVPAKKKDDAAFDVEQQFILRLPPVRLLLPIRFNISQQNFNLCYQCVW